MQKKLFRVMTVLVSCTMLIFLLIMGSLGYSSYKKSAKDDLKSAAEIVIHENNTPEEAAEILKSSLNYDVRVTFIKSDGTVAYDSEADISKMENHSDREEFKGAMENGNAESVRFSETLGKTTYYYAEKYQGGVLRVATDKSNLAGIFTTFIPIAVVLAGAIIFITTIISIKLSESMIKPINSLVKQLDLRNENIGEMETPYEELEPIIRNADVLMKRIHRNLDKIQREKEKISIITANMVEGMILLDSEMIVLSVNKSALEILESNYDVTEKEHITKLTDNKEFLELLDKAVEQGGAKKNIGIHGRYYTVFINKGESEKESSQFGFIIFLVDVTEAVQNEQIRKDFSANVSHELKTPLTTIKGFGEMLDNGIFTKPEDVKKYGGMIYRESERLLLLINDIIRLSEIEEQDHILNEDIDLLKTAEDVAEILQNKADANEISLHISGEPVKIKGNQSYITELILNLMDNSVKYNDKGGNVWAEISKDKNHAVIKVSDDGIGISEENQTRIFERFYRVDKSRSKQTGGTGLGLSIVKHIVSCHNGEISIKSEQGKGTEITVTFPILP